MNYQEFTARFSDQVYEYGRPQADNHALRVLAAYVGAELPDDVVVYVRTDPYDVLGRYGHTNSNRLWTQSDPPPKHLHAFSYQDLAAQRLELVTPEVTTENLTSQLARVLLHSTVFNEAARKREWNTKRREKAIIGLSVAALAAEGFITDFRNSVLAVGIMAAGFVAGALNRWHHKLRQQRAPVLPPSISAPITIMPHNS